MASFVIYYSFGKPVFDSFVPIGWGYPRFFCGIDIPFGISYHFVIRFIWIFLSY
jgi:predicted transcriptional regulator